MELKEGYYVRTKNGTIFKIIGGNIDYWEIDISYYELSRSEDEDFTSYAYNKNNNLLCLLAKKSSYNLIDLIEEGDYVNGYLVTFVYKPYGDKVIRIELERDTLKGHIISNSKRIKSVVTKEQFESVKYVL